MSRWSIRDYVASGKLPSVALPATTPKEGERDRETLRRLLINITDLNAFVDANKQRRG